MVENARVRHLKSVDRDITAQDASAQDVYGEKLYDVAEAAQALQVDASTIRRHVNNGDILAFKLGKKWRITQSDLYGFVAQLRQDRLDKAQEERLTREITATINRLKSNAITAQEWAITTCRRCTKPVLVRDHLGSWQGDCRWCDDKLNLASDNVKSFATIEREHVATARARIKRMAADYGRHPKLARVHAHTYCRRGGCYEWVLLTLDEEGTDPHWKGGCAACGYQHDLPHTAVKSLAEAQVEAARQKHLRESIQQDLTEAAQSIEVAQRTAKVECVGLLCLETIVVRLQDCAGEERWVGTCPFCHTDYDEPHAAAPSLVNALESNVEGFDDNSNMDDIPF